MTGRLLTYRYGVLALLFLLGCGTARPDAAPPAEQEQEPPIEQSAEQEPSAAPSAEQEQEPPAVPSLEQEREPTAEAPSVRVPAPGGALPSFPGAEGFGTTTPGGRGGAVYAVTTLEDYGAGDPPIPGSLRAAVEAAGPRIVHFRVAGNIELQRPLEVREPYLTLTGRTAPGEGVALANYGIVIWAPHVILRYLRVRPGDVSGEPQDAIDIKASYVVIDHCSAAWGTDETVSVTGGAGNVTIQWSLIAESLDDSIHPKGPHGYGTLIDDADSVTIHHNIYAYHRSRSPRPKDGLLDFRNNLVVGWGDRAGYNVDDATRMNYIANYLMPRGFSRNPRYAFDVGGGDSRIYVARNTLHGDMERTADNRLLVTGAEGVLVKQPFDVPPVETHPAGALIDLLLDGAGATLPARDTIDRRVIDLIRSGGGRIIDSQEEAGGWVPPAPGEPPADADSDGMPDEWELRHGLDPHDASDWNADRNGDGYTNLEEYLNGSAIID